MEARKDYYAPMHTAEHILNQTMVRMFTCERSFSNHIERKKSKCDYHFTKALNENEIEAIETQVNRIIKKHLPVTEQLLPFDEANKLYNLGKISNKNPERIRIVKVGDYDACPCIGAHVANTSEIGAFKISTTSFENGVLRIRYKLF